MESSRLPNGRAGPRLVSPLSSRQAEQICIVSWNSRGSSQQKLELMNKLVSHQIVGENIPILCNQNFLLKANSYKVFQAIPGFHFFINPAIKSSHNQGRPSNGMFICVPDCIKSCVTDISPDHWRVQAVVIESAQSKTLLINSYFPYDKRNQEDEEDINDLIETLEVIRNIIQGCECDSVVLAGDLNADYSRNTQHANTVKETIEEQHLTAAWDCFEIDFTCTYEKKGLVMCQHSTTSISVKGS